MGPMKAEEAAPGVADRCSACSSQHVRFQLPSASHEVGRLLRLLLRNMMMSVFVIRNAGLLAGAHGQFLSAATAAWQ